MSTCINLTVGKQFEIDGVRYPSPKPSRSLFSSSMSMLYSFAKGNSTSSSLDQDHESDSSSIASADELWTAARDGLLCELGQHKQLLDEFHAAIYPYLIIRLPQGGNNGAQSALVTVKKDAMPLGFKKNQGGSEDTLEGYLEKFMNAQPTLTLETLGEKQYRAFLNDLSAHSGDGSASFDIDLYQAQKLHSLFAPGQIYSAIRTSPFYVTSIEKELATDDKAVVLRNKLISRQFEQKLTTLGERIDRFWENVLQGRENHQARANLATSFCAVARLVPTVIEVRQQLIDMLLARAHSFDVVEVEADASVKRKNRVSTGAEIMV